MTRGGPFDTMEGRPDLYPKGPALTDWLTYVIPGMGLILGGGGLVAWYKARNEAKASEREHRQAETQAVSEHWRSLMETQTLSLLKPLESRVESLNVEVVALRTEVSDLKDAKNRAEYQEGLLWTWSSQLVKHIRDELPPPEPDKPSGLETDVLGA